MVWYVPIVAAAKKQRETEEEELMARQMKDELGDDWEFKVVRSEFYAFANRERLEEMLEEESAAGWQFAGKLDDNRVFLKRPSSAHLQDGLLDASIDPYRTSYGGWAGRGVVAVMIGLLVTGLLVLVLVSFGAHALLPDEFSPLWIIAGLTFILAIALGIVKLVVRR